MTKKKKLIWKIYTFYLIIIVLSGLAIAIYSSVLFKKESLNQISSELKSQAYLISGLIGDKFSIENRQDITKICKEIKSKISTRITVISVSGEVIGDSEEQPDKMENHSDRPEIQKAMTGNTGLTVRYSYTTKKETLYMAVPIFKNNNIVGIIRTAMPLKSYSQILQTFYLDIIIILFIIMIILSILGYFLSRRIIRPLNHIKEGAYQFANGNFNYKLYSSEIKEISQLTESLNRMSQNLLDKFNIINGQRNELEAILSNMVEAVIVIDKQEKILRINKSAENLLDIKHSNVENRTLQEVIRNSQLQKFVQMILTHNSSVESDIIIFNKEERIFQAHGSLLNDSNENCIGVLIVLYDLTRIKKLENLRREFVANVSHELKTPLTSIKGFIETLKDGAIDDKENAQRFLDIISNHTDRLNAIIDDLLLLSRLDQEDAKAQVIFEEEYINEIIEQAKLVCQEKADHKKISIQIECDKSINAKINSKLLEQALINLIDNAVKYSEVDSKIIIKSFKRDNELLLQVKDSGCGIPKEHLSRIFERFYRIDKARSRKEGGTGLGLAIVKHIAKIHHGHIDVESTPGKGSTFSIILPL